MIESVSNSKVKEVIKLQKNSRFRKKTGCFVVEGWRMISEVPNWYFKQIFVTEDKIEDLQAMFEGGYDALPVETVTEKVLKEMSLDQGSQGVLGLVKMPVECDLLTKEENPLIVVLEDVQDPGNLGTILRTAEAAGVDQVVMSKGTVDLYNPKVIKATMGAIFRLHIARDVDLEMYLDILTQKGVKIYGAHLKAKDRHFEADYTGGTAFLMGNEGNGLSDKLSKKATDLIKIPMAEAAESLNVAMATGILVYEAVRQRSV